MNALTTPNKTLFLSYSRRQTEWCDKLYTAIDTYTHYYRWRDNKIPESADWWDSICLNIEGCYAFVAILSQDYLDSVYCMGELEYALKLNKPVIALMLQDVDYPQKLNERRLQFAQVSGLDMPQVINKVLSAANQITLGYMQDDFSTDIHSRKHLRPTVPTPKEATPTPEEDEILEEQIKEVAKHGQIPTRDLLRRYSEEKERNIILARELLDKIMERVDVPVFFDIVEEDQELYNAEQIFAEVEHKREQLKKIRREYDDLAHYVSTARPKSAIKAITRFMYAYPEYGDPQELMQKFRLNSKSLMPAPFEWIEIPCGHGTMKTDENNVILSVPSETYWIAKYPVTNAQYREFIDAGGYTAERWWTKDGWQQKQKNIWKEPRYWQESKFNGDTQPVVGVSWYEAVAFCAWLSETTGEKIMLPTEAQWQYAAQGDDSRAYPWGNNWHRGLCNNYIDKKGISKTTPVTQYEGNSPFGVMDMAGNVWEWCLTDYHEKTNDINSVTNKRVLREGSWGTYFTNLLRCDCRFRGDPHSWFNGYGFRLSRS